MESRFFLRNGILYGRPSKRIISECELSLQQAPVKWSTFFKYLGSAISGAEGLAFLQVNTVANATKLCGALGLACKSAVAMLMSGLVDFNHSLVAPIGLPTAPRGFPFSLRAGHGFLRCVASGGGWWA